MRMIIRTVQTIPTDPGEPPRRAWLNISDRDGNAYHDVQEVLTSESLQRALMQRALTDLRAWEHRYQELNDICELVRTARSRLEARLSSQGAQPSA
jgi:hypothetical protein